MKVEPDAGKGLITLSRIPVLVFVNTAGLATRLPQPEDLVKYAESCMYSPAYRKYR